MKIIELIVHGRLKEEGLLKLEKNYLKRFKDFKFLLTELRPTDSNDIIKKDQNFQQEVLRIKKSHPQSFIIGLHESGKMLDSVEFSKKIFDHIFLTSNYLAFVVFDSFGPTQKNLLLIDEKISLGPMTLSHQICRLVAIEQIYRAYSLHKGLPYHHF